MNLFNTLLILCAATAVVAAQSAAVPTTTYVVVPESEPRERSLDITQMDLTVSFLPFEGTVLGKVVHAYKVLRPTVDSLEFDGIKLTVKQALINGKPVRFRTTDTSVLVQWDQTGTIEFTYEANPRKGL